jgi:hypothetical protein
LPAHGRCRQKYPGIVKDYERILVLVAALPCDIALAPHPEMVDFWERVARPNSLRSPTGETQFLLRCHGVGTHEYKSRGSIGSQSDRH